MKGNFLMITLLGEIWEEMAQSGIEEDKTGIRRNDKEMLSNNLVDKGESKYIT